MFKTKPTFASRNAVATSRNETLGYINIDLPKAGGGTRKLGAIKLTASEPELLEWLAENPDNITALMKTAQFSFNSAERKESSAFVLPSLEAPVQPSV